MWIPHPDTRLKWQNCTATYNGRGETDDGEDKRQAPADDVEVRRLLRQVVTHCAQSLQQRSKSSTIIQWWFKFNNLPSYKALLFQFVVIVLTENQSCSARREPRCWEIVHLEVYVPGVGEHHVPHDGCHGEVVHQYEHHGAGCSLAWPAQSK